ncbi:MAG: tetratricopeptide repeat protein [Gemmobacter sp.]
MTLDRQGNPLAGATPAATEAFDEGMECFALYRGDPIAAFGRAVAVAPGAALPHLALGWLFALATEPAAADIARGHLARGHALATDDRAFAHAGALAAVLDGNWSQAAVRLERWQAEAPRDLLSLMAGHLCDFFRADARALRDRVAMVLPDWRGVPGESWVTGMAAFGFEEAGDYRRAEALGRAAVEADPRDGWAHHAVAHVLEMQGRAREGLAWMAVREAHWADETNYLRGHNWWHRALCHIEAGEPEAALALYDGPMQGGGNPVAVALCDASALLWRLEMTGIDVGDRWHRLAALWPAHAETRLYPFNDLHAAMAWLGAGDFDRVEAMLAGVPGPGEAGEWTARIGRPLIAGFRAFRAGDYVAAVESLMPVRRIAAAFGGSHAQRDVIDWTLAEAAIRGRLPGLARRLAAERLALRPQSPVNLSLASRAAALV